MAMEHPALQLYTADWKLKTLDLAMHVEHQITLRAG